MPFSTEPSRCFARVTDPERHGQPMRCPATAPWRSIYAAQRDVYEVNACSEQAEALRETTTAVRPALS